MELWDLYDKDRNRLGKTMVRGEKIPEGTYRLVVHLCIFNSRGQMLIQQRQTFKDGWPGMWDVTVGGSTVAGESSAQAMERETLEEIGVKHSFENERPVLTVHFKDGFGDLYIINRDIELSELKLQAEEVKDARWASLGEILEMIDNGTFIPYTKSFIELAFFLKDRRDLHMKR